MSKQTAVEWLVEQLTPSISLRQKHIDELKEKAKEMEKQQIEDAYCDGVDNEYEHHINNEPRISLEQYYNEKFKK